MTGASAGAINALLSAITWCADDDLAHRNREAIAGIMQSDGGEFNSVNDNLLREIWLQVGFDALLPGNQKNNDACMP